MQWHGSRRTTPTTSTPLRQRPNAPMTSWLICNGIYAAVDSSALAQRKFVKGVTVGAAIVVRQLSPLGFCQFVPCYAWSPASKSLLVGLLCRPPRCQHTSGAWSILHLRKLFVQASGRCSLRPNNLRRMQVYDLIILDRCGLIRRHYLNPTVNNLEQVYKRQ
jgi:hypothetical protein